MIKQQTVRFLLSVLLSQLIVSAINTYASEPVTISKKGNTWTLQNETIKAEIRFSDGKLLLSSIYNREAKTDYLKGGLQAPLFTHVINGETITADDGGWRLVSATITDIRLYEIEWGKQLDITISHSWPAAFSVRQVFEIYRDRGGLRVSSFLKNETDKNLTVSASDVLSLNLPDQPHNLYYIDGVLNWKSTDSGLDNGGRNAIVTYATGDGWYILPENNWATSLEPGASTAHYRDKLLGIFIWNGEKSVRVATNPDAVQLTLFPNEELEYFAVNLGVFKGDVMDGRMAASEHLRLRYRYQDPSRILSTNDWQWGGVGGKRTDSVYRNILIPKAKAAGFDRIHIDDFWYEPEDGVLPKGNWTNMPDLCSLIIANGMIPGHWFSLQGKICIHGWGNGRDCADPANVDYKLKQLQDTLIGQYHTGWDQVDAGLLWKTTEESSYSNPGSSVYRKILGMRRYMNTITHQYPGFIMQTTCEVDNPAGPGAGDSHGNQNIGLIHLADNGIAGMYRRTEYNDDVRDLFADVGMFPLEGMLSTWGEDGNIEAAWKDSTLWYYQFLLARHTSIYSWPGRWSDESVKHMRIFNDWRKNPRIQSVLNELMRPVYNGTDWMKNEGPWAWMYVNETKSNALLFAINHLNLAVSNSFDAKLRWLDEKKTYLIEEITQLPDGNFIYAFRGEFKGEQLKSGGFPISLDAGTERCAAFWIQEKVPDRLQVVYADAAVTGYSDKSSPTQLTVKIQGLPKTSAKLIVYKPGKRDVEIRQVTLDAVGEAISMFDAATLTQTVDAIRSRQIAGMRFGMFICWSFSTFSGQEWTPTEGKDASFFRATGCNTDQWCQVAKDAGMHYILFLTKHHDGFCLWDTKTTDKKVTNSPLGIDVLAKLRKSCDKYGIKLALYFSEGDWTFPGAVYSKDGGTNPEIKKAQLKELLTGYGPVEYIWFDHAQGDGGLSHAETDKWVEQFQPDCLPGYNHGSPAGRIRLGEMGSPSALDDFSGAGYNKDAAGYKGYITAEFTYPILPGHKGGAMWFYSLPEHDNLCLPAERIYRDYLGAVKFGNIFSLDVGPDYKGEIRSIDVKTLGEVGKMIRDKIVIPVPLAAIATASSTWSQPGYEAGMAIDNNFGSRWGAVNDSRSGWLEINLGSEKSVSAALIDEGGYARVLKFDIQVYQGGLWKTISTGTSIGPYRKIEFPKPVKAQRFRLNILEANEVPTITEFQLF